MADYGWQGSNHRFPVMGFIIASSGKKIGAFTKEPKARQFARTYSKNLACKTEVIEGITGKKIVTYDCGMEDR